MELKVLLWHLLNDLPIPRMLLFYLHHLLFLVAVLALITSLRLLQGLLLLVMMRIAATLVVKAKVTPVLNPVTAVQIVIPTQLMILIVAFMLKLMPLLFALDLLSPNRSPESLLMLLCIVLHMHQHPSMAAVMMSRLLVVLLAMLSQVEHLEHMAELFVARL